ncbi:MAG: fibronectin type III domain-containing protein [Proteobacteria bacterium]|nr:fibronectin type III domain-containing protein [Pseudomonadota bacterium]MBU1544350.1 fibronectin type III domain-containing protein [Pseudomonadota bacterium]MBU2429075.1 fibronectin type III domain-containing protein [Pseudomonadota bacterium]MBU2479905.1 fibronectin type III domain-containing protein [Pseudomonadota bacterium]
MKNFFIDKKIKRLGLVLILSCFALFFSAETVLADCTVNFSWLPNTESNIKGYKIYYGQTEGGSYPNSVDVGNPAPVNGRVNGTASGLVCGQQYYFVCVAVNDANIESNYSVEVAVIPTGATNIQIPTVPGVEIIN